MRYLTVATIAKDEPDLPEWVAYHLAIGAEHILIYDNESRVPIRQTLRSFVHAGLVTVFDYRGQGIQLTFCDDIIHKGREEPWLSRWIANIDADEFLLPRKCDDLREVLRGFEAAPGVTLNWVIFGSAGHLVRPQKLVIDAYRMRQQVLHPLHKTIIDPAKAYGTDGTPHSYFFHGYGCPVNDRGQETAGPVSDPGGGELARINHYFCRSREDWDQKMARGSGDGGRKSLEVIEAHEACANEIYDEEICRFIPAVTKLLEYYDLCPT